ncbi:MAG TPA: ABC transporter substrate-binding protein [Stellaceae bacterium]|nr:ABC transporter substrate-binding protein [Stellaceae bacterium]
MGIQVARRAFMITLGGAAIAWPFAAGGQQSFKIAKVGVLYPGNEATLPSRLAGLREGLRQAGYREPDNVELVARAANGDPKRILPLAMELAERKVDVMVPISPAAIDAALAASTTIPIVALDFESDPIARGWIKTLSRPGGQVTGMFFDFPEFGKKWLELLKEVLPQVATIAVLWDPATGPVQINAVESAGKLMNVKLEILEVRDASTLNDSIVAAGSKRVDALLITSSPVFGANRERIAGLTLGLRLPAISLFTDFARAGGLMVYGVDPVKNWRQGAALIGKVLRGAQPAELPAELPTKFELLLNLKTAKSLGIVFPMSILARADEVIE